jgi:hypothetical protein
MKMNNIAKDVDRSGRGLIRVNFPWHLRGGTERDVTNLQDSVLAENEMQHLPNTCQ